MEVFKLSGELKESTGRRSARRLRREGIVPAVVYGHGENKMITVKEGDLRKLLITPNVYLIELEVGGVVEKVILKDVQYHPVSDRPMHIDFYRYVEDEPVTIAIPVILEGHSVGVRAGGKLHSGMRRILVKGLPCDLPDVLKVDVTNMRIGDVMLVGDVSFDKLTVVDTKTILVAAVKSQRGAVASGDEDPDGGEEATEAAAELASEE